MKQTLLFLCIFILLVPCASAGVTYNAGTDTITVVNYPTGLPCTFTDIYNADVAGGWGQVSKTSNMFVFDANLQIGDGITDTHLYDTFKKVTINKPWVIKNAATLRTGLILASEGNKPRKGCFLILNTISATAIDVETGGVFLQYQTLTEDSGTGTNNIVGATESFYGGASAIDIYGGMIDNWISIGFTENNGCIRVLESVTPYTGMVTYILRYNPVPPQFETCMIMGSMISGNFVTFIPCIGYSLKSQNDCTLIIDQLVAGDHFSAQTYSTGGNTVTKYNFSCPTGGSCASETGYIHDYKNHKFYKITTNPLNITTLRYKSLIGTNIVRPNRRE